MTTACRRCSCCAGGEGAAGQLGDGQDGAGYQSNVPVRVGGDREFTVLSAGAGFTAGIDIDSAAFAWGLGDEGQLVRACEVLLARR